MLFLHLAGTIFFGLAFCTIGAHCIRIKPQGEGLVEEYLEAREAAQEEIDEFMKTAPDGALPDPHTDAMEILSDFRDMILNSSLSESFIEDLLEGDPGLENNESNTTTTDTNRVRRTIVKKLKRRWDGHIIPYRYTDAITEEKALGIQRAMRTYERFTCMRFVPWVDGAESGQTTNQKLGLNHPGHLKFVSEGGCWSFVGNLRKASGQTISCCSGHTCIHELGHMFGFPHEQMSPNADRGGFIRINEQFISSRGRSQYLPPRSAESYISTGFDLNSYMHYATWMFAVDGQPTFSRLFPELHERGSYYYMMREVSVEHKCQDECKDFKLTCENDGYLTKVDGKCGCRCIKGLDPASGCTQVYQQDQTDFDFPGGQYALPMPEGGCPKGTWATGQRTHYNEGGNRKSSDYPLDGEVSETKIVHKFCVKDSAPTDTPWPEGNYCIYKSKGNCPNGFSQGSVQYDGQSSSDDVNSKSGELPDGEYGVDTTFKFCCRTSGFSDEEVYFPSRKPFVLMKHTQNKCQDIRGMHWTAFSHKIKSDQTTSALEGDSPVRTISGKLMTEFCSYRPAFIDCGGIIELDCSNTEFTFKSPAKSDAECYWLIKAPQGEKIALDFTEFDIKGEPGKCVDDLEVRYSRAGQPGLKYCGRSWGKTTISINSTLHIRLSTYGASDSHFTATARLIRDEDMCYSTKDRGLSYAGDINFTRDFEPCLPWHEVTHCEAHPFMLGINNINLDGNYCRLPTEATGFMPWCYTDKQNCVRNYCDVCQIGKRYDASKNCAEVKTQGACALTGCAKTCADKLPKPAQVVNVMRTFCTRPGSVSDGHPINTNKDVYDVGEVVTYKCDKGDTEAKRTCLSNGKWSDLGFVCTECPYSWHMHDQICYSEMYVAAEYDEAAKKCEEMHATVAMAKTSDQLDYLSKLVSEASIWLGVTDKEVEGTFKWVDGDPLTFSSWRKGQPDNYANGEHCVQMLGTKLWNDLPCTGYKHNYVCTKPSISVKRCMDFTPKCETWFRLKPTFCKDFPDFAAEQCQKTCALCGEKAKCSVENPDPLVVTDDATGQIVQGEVARYKCADGHVAVGGDDVRGCDSNGKLTGSPLKCLKGCPYGWTHRNNYCYRLLGPAKTYQQAADHCFTLEGTLVTIMDSAENEFVYKLGKSTSVWLGLDDNKEEGNFRWLDGTPLVYTNWKGREPNNGGWGEDCAHIRRQDKHWNDARCSSKLPYICKNVLEGTGATCSVENLDSSIEFVGGKTQVAQGQTGEYKCRAGHHFVSGDYVRRCNPYGKLTGSPLKCAVDATCSVEKLDSSVEIVGGKTQVAQGQTVEYKCIAGHDAVSGDYVRQCNPDGELTGSPLKCELGCAPGWVFRKEDKSCYRKFEEKKMYQEATAHCKSLGGILATAKDSDENDYLFKMKSSGYLWLGLNDLEVEGTFKWSDGSPLTFTYWNYPNPDNWNEEDCVHMLGGNGWNDIDCTYKMQYICKKVL